MTRLNAIIYYEVLMAWRRRSLPLIAILLLVGVIGFSLMVAEANQRWLGESMQAMIDRGEYTMEQFSTIALFAIIIAGMVFFSVGVTAIAGEVIPLDSQFKVRELLNTLPITIATYLGGKLLGAWCCVVLGWFVVGVITAPALWLIIGAYDLRVFGVLWVLLLLPAALTSAALSVLAAAPVKSRRVAVLTGVMVMPVALAVGVRGMVAFVTIPSMISPLYMYSTTELLPAEKIITDTVYSLLTHVVVILVAWSVVWLFLRWRQAR